MGGDLLEGPTSIKGVSKHQEIQHRASDSCYGDGQIYSRNEINRSAVEMTSELKAALEGVMETTCEMKRYSAFILCGFEQAP